MAHYNVKTELRMVRVSTRKVEELMVTATEEELQFQRKRLQSYKTEIRAIRTERDTVR